MVLTSLKIDKPKAIVMIRLCVDRIVEGSCAQAEG